jgi:hypothetical protein
MRPKTDAKHGFQCACALLALALAGGCGSNRANELGDLSVDVEVRLAVDRQAYRPGEAVRATVEIVNLTADDLQTRRPSFDSLRFYISSASDKLQLSRPPVYSKYDSGLETITLPPGGKDTRQFILTRFTERAGQYGLIVSYDMDPPPSPELEEAPEGEDRPPPRQLVWAKAVLYGVAGEPEFRRDAKGVLLEDDALDICLARLDCPASNIETRLVWNEAGFLDWWVCLTISPESLAPGQAPKRAWFVNPYLGVIRSTAPTRPTFIEERENSPARARHDRRAGAPGTLPGF